MSGTIDRFMSGARSGLCALAAAGALTAMAAPAEAAVIGSIKFLNPTGIVGPTDSIDVFVEITLDPSSDPLMTDASGNIVSGVGAAEWAAAGIDPDAVGYSYLNVFFQCGGTFASGCIFGPPYDVDFPLPVIPNHDFDIQPGGSLQFLFVTFRPSAGPVAPGDYYFYNMGLTATPLDQNGDPFGPPGNRLSLTLLQTCPDGSAVCAFTRTVAGVAPVPEPASWALMIGGFALAGAVIRRRPAAIRFA